LTFDDLAPDGGFLAVSNGYGGLNWSNFLVVNAVTTESPGTGYQNGMVTPSNVIFDSDAEPAYITSAGLFNLDSAYLTAAWDDGLNLEVQGFNGTTLIYDNTYTLITSGPTLANFNYLGINKVNFIPYLGSPGSGRSSHFVVDNLTISVPEPSAVTLSLAWEYAVPWGHGAGAPSANDQRLLSSGLEASQRAGRLAVPLAGPALDLNQPVSAPCRAHKKEGQARGLPL
jgi:hypothetical protein